MFNQPIGLCTSRWLLLLRVRASLWEHGWEQISSFRWWRFSWNGGIFWFRQHSNIRVLQSLKNFGVFNLTSFFFFYSSSQQCLKWLLQNIVEWRFSDYLSLPTKWSLRNLKKEMALIMPVTLKFFKMSNSLGKWILFYLNIPSVFYSSGMLLFCCRTQKYFCGYWLSISCTKNWNDSVLIFFSRSIFCYRKNVLALVKEFISKENIGKYLDNLPDVNFDYKRRKSLKSKADDSQVGGVSTSVLYLGVATIAVCIVINFLKRSKWTNVWSDIR